MAPVTDETLIQAVKSYPLLYDTHHQSFHDTKKRDSAWIEIANKFDRCSAIGCKRRWTVLRDCFRKTLRKRRLSQDPENGKTWRYEASMDFLVPFISERTPETCSNVSSLNYMPAEAPEPESDEQSSEFTNADYGNEVKYAILDTASGNYVPQNAEELLASCTKSNAGSDAGVPTQAEPKECELKRCLAAFTDTIIEAKRSRKDEASSSDPLAVFFRAMEETVRTFKYPLQIEIKGKIANLVNEYEVKNFTG